MLLARAGHDVLLVDRARFPSEVPHGHFIHRHGPVRLSRWGLLDRVLGTGCPAIASLTIDLGDFPLQGRDLVVDGIPVGLGPRRAALDQVLVEAAVEAGAELRDGFVVDELAYDEAGRVTGVEGRPTGGGGALRETATFVVGADGRVYFCSREGVPFVARGHGTGLSGGALPVPGGIVIGLARLNRVLDVDIPNRRVTVEPGVTNLEITRQVAPYGYYYAPDPSSQQVCSIGGNVAENSGGAHCLKYGFTVHHVLGVEAVLPKPWECKLLSIGRNEPCLMIRRRTWSETANVTVARLIYPGTRYRLEGVSQ